MENDWTTLVSLVLLSISGLFIMVAGNRAEHNKIDTVTWLNSFTHICQSSSTEDNETVSYQ